MEEKQKPSTAPADQADQAKGGHPDSGIPPGVNEEEPTGLPTSDRHHTEITPAKH